MHLKRPSERPSSRRGFTLVEAAVSVIIVATVLVAALETVGASARARFAQKDQSQGLALAREMLSEISQCWYADPNGGTVLGPDTGESARADFDDVDDYDNWEELPPRSRSGTNLPGFDGWKREVEVRWANPSDPANDAASDSGLKRITVKVTSPTGKATALSGLRSRNSAYDKQLRAQTTYVSWTGVTVQVGADPATKAVSGVNPLNQVP